MGWGSVGQPDKLNNEHYNKEQSLHDEWPYSHIETELTHSLRGSLH